MRRQDARDLDRHRRPRRVVVRAGKEHAIGVDPDAIEVAADEQELLRPLRVGPREHADHVDGVDLLDRAQRDRHSYAIAGVERDRSRRDALERRPLLGAAAPLLERAAQIRDALAGSGDELVGNGLIHDQDRNGDPLEGRDRRELDDPDRRVRLLDEDDALRA